MKILKMKPKLGEFFMLYMVHFAPSGEASGTPSETLGAAAVAVDAASNSLGAASKAFGSASVALGAATETLCSASEAVGAASMTLGAAKKAVGASSEAVEAHFQRPFSLLMRQFEYNPQSLIKLVMSYYSISYGFI